MASIPVAIVIAGKKTFNIAKVLQCIAHTLQSFSMNCIRISNMVSYAYATLRMVCIPAR